VEKPDAVLLAQERERLQQEIEAACKREDFMQAAAIKRCAPTLSPGAQIQLPVGVDGRLAWWCCAAASV
jgi:hypothetical protein